MMASFDDLGFRFHYLRDCNMADHR